MSESFIVIFDAKTRIKVWAKDAAEALQESARSHPGPEPIEVCAQADMKPCVGMPATHHIGSDSYGGRIIAVSKTGHRVTWQRVASDGTSQANFVHEYSRRRDGRYLEIGSKHGTLELGIARTVLDEGF